MSKRKTRVLEYTGESLTVLYDVARCIHAEECVKGLPAVFDPDRRPWVEPDHALAEEVRGVIHLCPTGALRYVSRDGVSEPVPEVNSISIAPRGPIYIEGNVTLEGPEAEARTQTRLALCRCGASANKPYCDNRHAETGFDDPARLGESKLTRTDAPGTSLTIRPAPDGPLIVSGPMTVRGPEGEPQRGDRCALCRCGASANKPYCDGSHKAIGFTAE